MLHIHSGRTVLQRHHHQQFPHIHRLTGRSNMFLITWLYAEGESEPPPPVRACSWEECWRLEIYLPKQELLIASIMTSAVNCVAHEEECQQPETAVSYLSPSSNNSGLNKSTGKAQELLPLESVPLKQTKKGSTWRFQRM